MRSLLCSKTEINSQGNIHGMDPNLLLTLGMIHAAAVTLCTVIMHFMAKPFRAIGDTKYLRLPLGFGFLRLSHVFSASTFFASLAYLNVVVYLQPYARSFAFTFLTIIYYFSGISSDKKGGHDGQER